MNKLSTSLKKILKQKRSSSEKREPRRDAPLVSVVIPAFNSERSLRSTVYSLIKQSLSQSDLEIIIVNDGSTDGTLEVCHELSDLASNIVIINKDNGGVGSARNAGINKATGKYIAFLDSDDALLPDTLEKVTDFFDKNYSKVDAVSYPMKIYCDREVKPHVREKILTQTGIYPINKLPYAFALITNVNVIVKNDSDLPRFREDLIIHEDEVFFLTLLLKKNRVGFCKKGAYLYQQHPHSAINTKMHPYFQFEENIGFWEEFFKNYPNKIPLYLQASFLNEINWKLKKNLVFPLHYSKKNLDRASDRIVSLLSQIENKTILNAPRADVYLKHYLISLKKNSRLSATFNNRELSVQDHGTTVLSQNKITIEFTKTKLTENHFWVRGALKSIVFKYSPKPKLFVNIANNQKIPIPLFSTRQREYETYSPANMCWEFNIKLPIKGCAQISFETLLREETIPLSFRFSALSRLNSSHNIYSFTHEDRRVTYPQDNRSFIISQSPPRKPQTPLNLNKTLENPLQAQALAFLENENTQPKEEIWLYYDLIEHEKGDAHLQFIHDSQQNDGICRYFICKNAAFLKMNAEQKLYSYINFNDTEHCALHFSATKIIASFIEIDQSYPLPTSTMRSLANYIDYDMVYLNSQTINASAQEPCLSDRLFIDYEVVSSPAEKRTLIENYHLLPEQVISEGLPHFDLICANKPSGRRILFAPTYKKYLLAEESFAHYSTKPNLFHSSSFWKEASTFLQNPQLHEILSNNDFTLEIQLHPFFEGYLGDFASCIDDSINSPISMTKEASVEKYAALITDNPLEALDFVHIDRPILYFLPDSQETAAGLNGFHKPALPYIGEFGTRSQSASDLIDEIARFIKSYDNPHDSKSQQDPECPKSQDTSIRKAIYKALND